MIGKVHISRITGVLLCLIILNGCMEGENRGEIHLPTDTFHDGDLAFRRGTGLTSRIVLAADKSGDFSHVGILKQIDGKWHVIHAVPGEPDYEDDVDRVKLETVEHFFAAKRAAKGAVLRVKGQAEAAERAAAHAFRLFQARILFDHDYDLADTTRMYCTELIDHVYKKEGIDLSEGRLSHIRIPGLGGDYLLPSDIAQSDKLRLIYSF